MDILSLLNTASPIGVIGLLAFVIYLLVSNKRSEDKGSSEDEAWRSSIELKLKQATNDNHHELLDALGRIESSLAAHSQQEIVLMNDISKQLSYLSGRINGKNHGS